MLFYVIFIPLTIVTMGFMAYMWREEVREWGIANGETGMLSCGTFFAAPVFSFVVAITLDIVIRTVKFWLIPIVLVVGSVLTFVYWDVIKEYLTSQRGE